MGKTMFRLFTLLALACTLAGCAGAAYELPPVSAQDLHVMKGKMAERPRTLKIYDRPNWQYHKMLNRINYRLASNAVSLCDYAQYPNCNFSVAYSPGDTMNAVAYEGYKITVFRGLLQYMKNEDEIAGVVAHEMGHHLAHHNKETAQNAMTGAVVSGVLAAVILGAAGGSDAAYAPYQQRDVQDAMSLGAKIGATGYTKEQEREADLLAAYLLARAGYNLQRAQGMLFTLSQLPGSGDQTRPSARDTHPAGAERLVAWEKAMTEIRNNPRKLPYEKKKTSQP